jgi:hypothetical protein
MSLVKLLLQLAVHNAFIGWFWQAEVPWESIGSRERKPAKCKDANEKDEEELAQGLSQVPKSDELHIYCQMQRWISSGSVSSVQSMKVPKGEA